MTKLETRASHRIGDSPSPTDAELLARWCGGIDPAALEAIIRRHGGMVWGVCRRILGYSADAEDAFQATFLVLVRKAATLGRPDEVAGWLHRVALRVSRKVRAERARRYERETAIVDIADPAAPDPSDDRSDLRQAIDAELDRLPDKYRLPIVLCELEGLTLEGAAQALGWPKGTVAGRLSRGRELLRRRLSRRGRNLPFFMVGFAPAVQTPSEPPPESLVSATTTATAAGQAASPSAALAESVLHDAQRRRFGLLVIIILAAAAMTLLGWQVRAATHRRASEPIAPAQPDAPAPSNAPAACGCHAHPP